MRAEFAGDGGGKDAVAVGVVTINCADEKVCNTLARSVGRRAAHRGYRADLRRGEGYLSVRKSTQHPVTLERKRR